jgi:hypothetical protein
MAPEELDLWPPENDAADTNPSHSRRTVRAG